MSQLTINQHYVPKCLLKHFSANSKTNVYDSENQLVKYDRVIKRTFSEDYFYDEDNSVETPLEREIETPAAPIIDEIVSAPRHSRKVSMDLLRFIVVQLNRTPGRLGEMQKIGDRIDASGMKPSEHLDDLQSGRFELDNRQHLLSNAFKISKCMVPLFEDLEHFVLINKTQIPFVLSDHPVIQYNYYLRESRCTHAASPANHGLQIFIPLSKSVMYCLYDKKVYLYGKKTETYSELTDTSDIQFLNTLQVLNRKRDIVFSKRELASYVRELCDKYPAGGLYSYHSEHSTVWRTYTVLPQALSKIKIKRKARKKANKPVQRCPDTAANMNLCIEQILNIPPYVKKR